MSRTTSDSATTFTTPTDREIVIARTFDAPRELVFAAFTKPEHLPNWMGPAAYKMVTCDMDVRPGGTYRWAWSGADGSVMGMGGTFEDVSPPERIVTIESFDDFPGETRNTLVFTEEDGRTTATITVLYASKEARDGALASGMTDGMSEGYERLEALLRSLT
jgi:uncharacterized protein YndB with AHSA1/START domain